MQKFFKPLILCLCLTVLAFSTPSFSSEDEGAFDRSLIVLASTSMTNAMHEILKNFSQEKNISISSTFSSTEELANSIEDGQPANILISEDPKKMRDLQRKGVLNVFSLSEIVGDKLVIVMPKNHYLIKKIEKYKTLKDRLNFLLDNSIMAIPDSSSDPAGLLIEQTMEVLKLKHKMDSKTVKIDNNRRALYMAANANNTAIVYKSDAKTQQNIVIIDEIPQKYYDKIIYRAAIVTEISKGSDINDSEEFVKYLKQDKTQNIFEKYGFDKI